MKKTILATMIAVFLIFEGSGCGMTKPVSAQEKIISVMKEKYGEELTPENIDYLTQRIWEYINSKIKRKYIK